MKEVKQYRKYLKEHIGNVQLVWEKLQPLCVNDFFLDDYNYFVISELVKQHDKSKYKKNEFEAYRQYFYPANDKEENINCFNFAWNIHQKINKHHWQYWTLIEDNGSLVALEMPFVYIAELLCDWTAMSIKFNNKPSDWYKENKNIMTLAKNTRIGIERWLPLFDKVWAEIMVERGIV